jgi:uncharacterized protein
MRLTVYCDETENKNGRAVFELIVKRAQETGCERVFVSSGIMGASRDTAAGYLNEELPVMVEVIATEARMNMLIPLVKDIVHKGTTLLSEVRQI